MYCRPGSLLAVNFMSVKRTVAQTIAGCLVRHGIRSVFSQSLPSAVALALEDLGVRQIAYRTENAGGAMADGLARLTGQAAVVMAQNGPAATLLVPSLAEALKASIPVIALVQEVNRPQADRNAFQEIDHFALFAGVAKWIRKLVEPSRTADYVDLAFANATGGRPGPVVLLLPADLLLETVPAESPRGASLGRFPLDRFVPSADKLDEAAGLLIKASRPLIIAGGGVHISGASKSLAELQDRAHLPVLTTVMGKGAVDENHPLSLGVAGYALGRFAPARHMRDLIQHAEVVLLVGTRTNQNGTDSWTAYPDKAKYIHIDVDATEIGRNYEALRLVGDARETLTALTPRLAGRRSPIPGLQEAVAAARIRHREDMQPLYGSNKTPIRPERLMVDIQSVLTEETVVVADASYSTLWIACYLRSLAAGMRFITPRGLAGLGWGLPLALGAKAARPQSPVLAVVGDGGFAHVWSELETSRRMHLPVVVIVLNNGVLAYQQDAEDVKFGRHTSACAFTPVDHALIAQACGCRGLRVDVLGDFLPALREALAAEETTVIDVVTDPEAYPPITFFEGTLEKVRAERAAADSRAL
jgi:acetolactate synthase-1/2/3 large subunit